MHCPQCTGYRLEPKELEKGLIAAGCSKCEGAMLSLLNYRFWAEHQKDETIEKVEVEAVDDLAEGAEKAKVCPKCTRLMTKFKIDLGTANKLDLCVHCDEAWLDKGEWRLLKQLELDGKLPQIFTDAWQKGLRKEKTLNRVKERYIDMIGKSDFEKVDDFKAWLLAHPNKKEIKQYLITQYD